MNDLIRRLAQDAENAAVEEWSGPAGPRTAMHVFVEQAIRGFVQICSDNAKRGLCEKCSTPVEYLVLSVEGTFWCGVCQRWKRPAL